jgi:hypothetical protein
VHGHVLVLRWNDRGKHQPRRSAIRIKVTLSLAARSAVRPGRVDDPDTRIPVREAAHPAAAHIAIGQVKPRKWAIDWAFIPARIAVEVEGGYAIGGRHTSAKGFLGDQEKYNCLTCLGWRLIRVTPRDVKSGAALTWIQRALASPMFVRVA